MFRPLLLTFLLVLGLGCNEPDQLHPPDAPPPPPPPPPVAVYSYQTFVNVDSVGVNHGYGYDIYEDDKRLIHQLNIPGEPGIEGFVTDAEAALVANLVVEKMKTGGGFPTISHTELIDLGITLNTK